MGWQTYELVEGQWARLHSSKGGREIYPPVSGAAAGAGS